MYFFLKSLPLFISIPKQKTLIFLRSWTAIRERNCLEYNPHVHIVIGVRLCGTQAPLHVFHDIEAEDDGLPKCIL
ncbi:hypothetical protein PGT21_004776 [Puccinia graminis f. sp. tritici]|uniref:Uncharacterized protein n=1 Tax=Puccinia graminis f. sp. tritici TaxID=56615 RepID=A0A5B0PSN6_PUCGR|nr:hypothetical protein PGTUg99_022090 [Puccinia graminis f. sp. tritici]KAA1103926.1 hypothetical protein PGT21_004776 [Puccinia graminis f. sp. tritici]